jgi:opacity protein-like surface antigen
VRTASDFRIAPNMNILRTLPRAGLVASVLGAAALAAQAQLDDEIGVSRNRVNIAARFAFNISARVTSGPTPPNVPPIFDDGYVRTDSSGNVGGKTWYWGYDHDNQLVNGNLEFHAANSPRDGTSERFKDDPHAGFEITYGRELGRLKLSKHIPLIWGVSGGFSSLDLELGDENRISGNVIRTAYRYPVGNIIVPLAPYYGSFYRPGPLLGTTLGPSGDTAVLSAVSEMAVNMSGLLYGLKVGPFVEVPLGKRLTLALAGGLAALNADMELSYTETVTFPSDPASSPPPVRSAKASHGKWMAGFYGNASLAFALTDNTSIFLGGAYHHLGDMSVSAGPKSATVGLGQVLELTGGLRFTF